MKYEITNQKDLRAAFWQSCEMCSGQNCNCRQKRDKKSLDAMMCFGVFKDSLCKEGRISMKLYDRATLF